MEQLGPARTVPARRYSRLLRLLPAMLLAALVVGGVVPYLGGPSRAYLSYLVLARGADPPGAALAAGEVRAAGGRVVQEYPQIGAVLAYATGAFAGRLRGRLGIAAVGATRTVPVPTPPEPLSGAAEFTGDSESGTEIDRGAAAVPPARSDRPPWNLAMIGAAGASPSGTLLRLPAAGRTTGPPLRRVLVAVLDSGVDDTHPDLRRAVDPHSSASCADGRPDARNGAWRPDPSVTESGHGTHVAGIIGASSDGQGITGVAPGVRIAAVRLLGPLGQYYAENIVCGMLWAADHGARAINDSYFADPWKYNCPEDLDQAALIAAVGRAVAYTQRRGAVVVASAGNDGQDLDAERYDRRSPNDRTTGPPQDRRLGPECIRLPDELPGVVSVAAVDRQGQPTGYSNYGTGRITLAAPGGEPESGQGEAVLSDWPGGRYAALAGTSMAAAHVTGALALLAAAHPELASDRLADQLTTAATARCAVLPGGCPPPAYAGAGLLTVAR